MFDNWEKIAKIYDNISDEQRAFLDANIISQYIHHASTTNPLPVGTTRQLTLYCRLHTAGLSTPAELQQYITEAQLPQEIVQHIVSTCLAFCVTKADYAALAPAIKPETRAALSIHATGATQYLLSHNQAKIALADIAQKYKSIPFKSLLILTGDIILGFYRVEDTVPLLQQELGIDPKTAALLGAEVLEFLAPLSDPDWQPPVEEDDAELAVTPTDAPSVSVAVRTADTNPVVDTVPATTSFTSAPDLAAPVPLHTYASDLAAVRSREGLATPAPAAPPATPYVAPVEPVYRSSQPDPIPRTTLGTTPSYSTPTPPPPPPAAPASPRWSSDV